MKIFDEFLEKLPKEYQERLTNELEVITNNGIQNFMPYFITLSDIIKEAKNNGMMVGPARGCLTPDVCVFTKEKGFLPICNIEIGDTVITHLGNYKKVLNTFTYDYSSEIYEFEIFGDIFNRLKVTPDHKIYVKNKNGIEWKQAKDINSDDYFFVPCLKNEKNNNTKTYDLKKILKDRKYFRINNQYIYQHIPRLKKSKFSMKNLRKITKFDKSVIRNLTYYPEKLSVRKIYLLNKIAKQSKLSGIYELRDKIRHEATHVECLNRIITINADFCFLMGVFNACGTFNESSVPSVTFGGGWGVNSLVIPDLIKKTINHSVVIIKSKKDTDGRVCDYRCYSKLIFDFFKYFCGNAKNDKQQLSIIVDFLSKENLNYFLAGFLFGLNRGKEATNVFHIKDLEFSLSIRTLLWKLQIPHCVDNVYANKAIKYKFTLFLDSSDNAEKTEDGMWLSVKTIKKYKKNTKIHDLEIEHDNSFLTASGVVHNSAGGSLVAYLLGITAIDPIKYNLPFARFLSKSRLKKSVPDIDVDFEVNDKNKKWHRNYINDYIFEKYGDKAAQIATFGMLKLKNSLQDSFRIYVSQPTENKIALLDKSGKKKEAKNLTAWLKNERFIFDNIRKNLGKPPAGISDLEWLNGYTQDDVYYPGLLESNAEFKKWGQKYLDVINTTKLLLGIPRNIGKHAAGVVIADRPIHEICGVMKIDGNNVIAYNKKDTAKLGLIKNDNLGLTCLNFIGDTLRLLNQKNIKVDPWNLPDDEEVFTSFLDGKCLTIFQHETSGGASFVKKLIPKCKEDLFVSVALNRPGALDAKIKLDNNTEISAAEAYIQRKSGKLPIAYLHSDLEPILKSTFGIYAFQEQVMASLQFLLGYTEEESDSIRSAISDKNIQAFDDVKKRLPILLNKGWSQEQIDDFFQQIIAFSGYAFNRSHACAYGLLAYATAYLKYHYPIEWWASVLSNSTPDEVMDKYWAEISHFIIEPNINISKNEYVIKDQKLIPPLNLIKGIGQKALEEITNQSPFANIEDFVQRINKRSVNKTVVNNLIKSGAMNCLFDVESLSDKFVKYYELKAKFENKKKSELEDGYLNLTPYEEFILAKDVLPISNKSLSDSIAKTPKINKPFVNVTYYTSNKLELNLNSLRGILPLIDGYKLNKIINQIQAYCDNYLEICCYGYVTNVRKFSYFSKAYQIQKNALEVNIDFDNYFFKIVCWPGKMEKSAKIETYIKEKNVFLFKLRIDKIKQNISIVGIEDIKFKT